MHNEVMEETTWDEPDEFHGRKKPKEQQVKDERQYMFFNQTIPIYDEGVFYTFFVYEIINPKKIENDNNFSAANANF